MLMTSSSLLEEINENLDLYNTILLNSNNNKKKKSRVQ